MTDHELHKPTLEPGEYCTRFAVPGGLLNRRAYSFCASSDAPGIRYLISGGKHLPFTIVGAGNHLSQFPERWPGTVCPRVTTTVELNP